MEMPRPALILVGAVIPLSQPVREAQTVVVSGLAGHEHLRHFVDMLFRFGGFAQALIVI